MGRCVFNYSTKLSMAKAILTKKSPFYVQFYVSNRCHLNCKMCNIVSSNSQTELMDPDHYDNLAKNMSTIGVGVVLLTGGEPFLNKNIELIVKALKKYGLDVRLQTAGLVEKKDTIIKCHKYGINDINVSIDSLSEDLSDFINGKEGSFRKAIQSISFISQNFNSKKSICALGCVLSNYNIDEIESLLDFCTRIGWWLSLVPVHLVGNGQQNFRGNDENFRIPEEKFSQLKELINRLKHKKSKGYLLFNSDVYLDSMYSFITQGESQWRNGGICDTPNLYFVIKPDGKFAPCCDYNFEDDIYVYDEKFPEIYKAQKFYQKVKESVKSCDGCNYGSFPEMSLSVRSLSSFLERVKIYFNTFNKGIIPYTEDQLFEIMNSVKMENQSVYTNKRIVKDIV